MDANTYFANINLEKYQSGYTLDEAADEMAQTIISDKTSELYPWTSNNVYEALSEMTNKECDRITSAHADDRELAVAVREVVLSYWLNFAKQQAIDTLEGCIMECTQDLHQQQLEQQEQEEQSIIRVTKNHHGNEMRTHIWGSDETVFLNIDSGICHQSFFLTRDQAFLLAKDLLKARDQA